MLNNTACWSHDTNSSDADGNVLKPNRDACLLAVILPESHACRENITDGIFYVGEMSGKPKFW
jgi:hypothetical protein